MPLVDRGKLRKANNKNTITSLKRTAIIVAPVRYREADMFFRSENTFLRPAWPEDRPALDRAGVPAASDPLRQAELTHALMVTLPTIAPGRVAGTAGLVARNGRWLPRIWLAPAFRHLGLFEEIEDALMAISDQLPDPSGSSVRNPVPQLAAA